MTDDQHGESTPGQGGHGGWERLPQGDYDDGATTFVQLPEGGIDALLAANTPLAAPGQGYVPPPITVTPATTAGTDPAATGSWTMPAEGAQWPDPHAVPQEPGGHEHHEHAYGYQPGGAGQWTYAGPGQYEEPGPYEETGQEGDPAPGHDVTGQWSIPVAGGELPDESGEFTQSALVEQWGGTPPATLPGGAPAPWATEAIGTAWTAPPPAAPGEAPGEPSAEPYGGAPAEMPGEGPGSAQEATEGSVFAPGTDPAETLRFPALSKLPPRTPETTDALPDAPDAAEVPEAATATADVTDASEEAEVAPTAPGTLDPTDDPAAAEDEPAPVDVPDAPAPDAPGEVVEVAEAAVTVEGVEPAEPVEDGAPEGPADAEPAAESPVAVHDDHPLASYVLRVNGTDRPVTDAWIGESLLYVLRERLGLAGAKDGCSQGECGACNVQVEGRLVASCLVPAVTAAGSEVRTVEGLAEDGQPSDVQRALARCGAVQCGFCVPGMAMTVHDLLEGNPEPTELETRAALCGNLCRCSGYRGVLEAVREVVAEREAHTHAADGSGTAQDAEEARIPHQAGPGAGGVNPAAYEEQSAYEDQAGYEDQPGYDEPSGYEDPAAYQDPSGYDPQGQPPQHPAQRDQTYGQDGGGQA
ncbi:hypothetical protein GCM10010145_23960 [Streptomyces ruber]|uniref:2Fe-2S ferredoxin-type domain-containing protein n=2 Tax=Streptomyces TaxID=1883 RepID=A0A918BAW8_9ACTN|nr:2Fe-2S iron-sulfur cluster-binding protein [Streptomyces ruber]GGQ53797.1 hypothetical protein GCM10010145_23960 [Streptomyces ruber]